MNVYEVYITTAVRYTVKASNEHEAKILALNMPTLVDDIDIQPEAGEITRVKYIPQKGEPCQGQ
jgi:hypothetical protein